VERRSYGITEDNILAFVCRDLKKKKHEKLSIYSMSQLKFESETPK
jgi:hypothetical protein